MRNAGFIVPVGLPIVECADLFNVVHSTRLSKNRGLAITNATIKHTVSKTRRVNVPVVLVFEYSTGIITGGLLGAKRYVRDVLRRYHEEPSDYHEFIHQLSEASYA